MAAKRIIADVTDEVNKFSDVMGGVQQSTGQIKQDFNDILASAKGIKDATKGVTFPSTNAANVAGTVSQAETSMNTFEPSPNASTIVAQTKDGARQTDYGQTGGNGGYTPGQGDDSYSGPNWKGYGGWSENPKTSGGFLKAAGKSVVIGAAGAINAAATAIDTPTYVSNDVSRRRFGFFSGQYGTKAGSQAFEDLMSTGTASSSLDAADAAMAGVSSGMMPGLKNYKGIMKSVAGVSNMLPGAGLTASMGAVGALNQASSVNKLRMIGIQVRDQKGYMRDVEAIANDLWNMLNKSKTGGANITAEDLSYSLQPGMSLDSLLNQYFSGDPVLRDSIIAYLYQFASGKSTSKANLKATGANPSISQSMSARMASAYKTENFFTNAGIAGIEDANKGIIAVSDNLRTLNTAITENTVRTLAATEVFTGAADGAMGQIITTTLTAAAPLLLKAGSSALAPIKALGKRLRGGKGLGSAVAGIFAAGGLFDQLFGGNDSASADTGNSDTTGTGNSDTSGDSGNGTIRNGGISDTRTWAKDFLTELGYKDTPENLDVVQAWITHENSQYSNNPLAITHVNSNNRSQVSEFSTYQGGIKATADLLKNNADPTEKYYKINQALKAGNDEGATWAAIATSPWDATRYGTNKVGQATYYGPGGTINITINGADLADSKQLAKDIKDQIDTAIEAQRN